MPMLFHFDKSYQNEICKIVLLFGENVYTTVTLFRFCKFSTIGFVYESDTINQILLCRILTDSYYKTVLL